MKIFTLVLVFISFFNNPIEAKSFSVKREANQKDWQLFYSSTPSWRRELWNSAQKESIKWQDWHWTWRIGWVKTCASENSKYCNKILSLGLNDHALVIRLLTIKKIGHKYWGKKNKHLIEQLKNSFLKEKSGTNAMKMKKRLLWAILKIDGENAIKVGSKLAQKNVTTKNYWQKILCIHSNTC